MPSKVKTIKVINMRQVKSAQLDLNGATVLVTGKNNSGKSTLLRALSDRLRGIKPDMILRIDENNVAASNGSYVMELTTGEKLIWEVATGGKEKLKFISERDIKGPLTKEIMTYYFPKTFDVDSFLNDPPSKQRIALQKICGLDFTDIDKALAEARENRTWADRKLTEATAQEIQFEPHWSETVVDVEAHTKELYAIGEHNLRYASIQEKLAEKKKKVEENNAEYQSLETSSKQYEKDVLAELEAFRLKCEQRIAANVEETKKKQAALGTALNTLQVDIEKGEAWLLEDKNKPKDDTVKKQLEEKIADIRKNNEAIDKKAVLQKAAKNYKEADDEVKKITADKDEMIRLSDMPEGFSFNDEGILYNGHPFDRSALSSSAVYIAALKLAAKGLGDVKAIHFDASFLDKISLGEVNDWAESQNLQLLIERPDFEAGEITYEIMEEDEQTNKSDTGTTGE